MAKKNIIRATGVSGIYKDKDIEIKIGKNSEDSQVLVNGKEIGKSIFGIHIHMRAGQKTTVILEKHAEGII